MILRPYQQEAIDSLFDFWAAGHTSGIIVLPTGAGKSLVMASLATTLIERYADLRICITTHVRELISQNYAELVGISPWAPAGIYSAGLGRRDTQSQILFCGIQSVREKAHLIGHVDVLFIDECHLIPRKAETGYGVFIAALRAINPDMRIVGLTATDYRLDSGKMTEPFEKAGVIFPPLFDDVIYEISIAELIKDGYLSPLISKATATVLDVSGVHKLGGEFRADELEEAVDTVELVQKAVAEIIVYGNGGGKVRGPRRRSWLVFCAGVAHAEHVRDEFRRQGVTAEVITGGTPKQERDRIVAAFKRGDIRALTNANVLTTGFNAPATDLLAMLRPTMSTSLYVQMVGRGSRNAPGKENCLVLDFALNVSRHGPVDAVAPRKPGGGGDAPVKICPMCDTINYASARVCIECGHEFEIEEKAKHSGTAAWAPILSTVGPPPWIPVDDRSLISHWPRKGGPASVRVVYQCGFQAYTLWLNPESPYSKGVRTFAKFWREHGGLDPIPPSADNAVARQLELTFTSAIQTQRQNGYDNVIRYKCGPPMTADERAEAVEADRFEQSKFSATYDQEIPF